MDIKYNYGNDTLTLISGSVEQSLPENFPSEQYIVKLSVYNQNGSHLNSFDLNHNSSDYYIKDDVSPPELLLKPNDKLDEGEFFEGNYELQYDFIERINNDLLYVDEISSTRKEIRIRHKDGDNSWIDDIVSFYGDNSEYDFSGKVELSENRYISVNAYALDTSTYSDSDETTIVFKLNTPAPSDVTKLSLSLIHI